jgi:signal transduction histidine kinase
MPIRYKLLVLISLIFAALLINLFTLGYLGRTTLVAFSTINDANDQLATAISMQAQMRGAEAALYRYLMEGVEGFAVQYQSQIKEFDNSLEVIRSSPLYRDNPALVDELMQVFHEANVIGNQLLQLRDQQAGDLHNLIVIQSELENILAAPFIQPDIEDTNLADIVFGMNESLRDLTFVVTTYLALPEEAERVRFTEAMVNFHRNLSELQSLAASEEELNLLVSVEEQFGEIQNLGSRLINGRDQQEVYFANFALLLHHASKEILVGKIKPQATQNILDAQNKLKEALSLSVNISLITTGIAILASASVTIPLFRQVSSGILALTAGSDRVAAGDFSQPVQVSGRDELSRLAQTFNLMMKELGNREQRLHGRLSELEALQQINLEITSSLEIGQVLDTIASSAIKLANAAEVHIFLCDEEGINPSFIANAWKDMDNHPPKRMPRPDGLVATVLLTQEITVVNQADEHPLYSSPEIKDWGIKAVAAFPMKLSGKILGVFYISFDDRNNFSEDELRIIRLLVDQATVALQNAQLYQDLLEKEAHLQTLAQKLVNVQEEERRLVGLDLHDGLTQLLLSVNMHLNTLASLKPDLDSQATAELSLGRTRLRQAIQEAQQVVSELRPAGIEELGLVDGLRQYLLQTRETRKWEIEYKAAPGEINLAPAYENAIFRIAQEALTNAYKHGQAAKVKVHLHTVDDKLILEVRDWGHGFEPEKLTNLENKQLGLLSMQERAALLGGECKIESQPGRGTRVWVSIPFFQRREDESK